MPYSDRQLAHLSAMGLVAWVERRDRSASSCAGHQEAREPDPPDPPERDRVDAARAESGVPADDERGQGGSSERAAVDTGSIGQEPAAAALPMPMPREPSVLATWLPAQPLATFAYRERTLTRVGREDAPLLIVVERGVPDEGLPLVDEAAELFERMLRAIGMTRRDTRQCVLSAEPSPDDVDTVGAFALAPYRAALVLMQELDGELDAAACRFRLGEGASAHPGWCLPHPDRLLDEPRRKAQAWQVLKALRRHLDAAA